MPPNRDDSPYTKFFLVGITSIFAVNEIGSGISLLLNYGWLSSTISESSATAILESGVVFNGVVLGFILIGLFRTMESKEWTKYRNGRPYLLLLTMVDGGMLLSILRAVYYEFVYLGIMATPISGFIVGSTVDLPFRVGIYLLFRVPIMAFMTETTSRATPS